MQLLKSILGAIARGIIGYSILFTFTAITGIWFVLLKIFKGLSVTTGLLIVSRKNCHKHLIEYSFIVGITSFLTVAISEYQTNRFMFIKSNQILQNDYSFWPQSLNMYFDIVISNFWWQPIIGII